MVKEMLLQVITKLFMVSDGPAILRKDIPISGCYDEE